MAHQFSPHQFPLHTDLTLAYRVREATTPSGERLANASLLLLLHGVGSNERDLLQLEPELVGQFHVVSARAPLDFGPDRYGWFNFEFAPVHRHDPGQAEASRQKLLAFMDELTERYRLPSERVLLMGFSQGAIMSFSVALTAPEKIAGVVGMSGRVLPEAEAKRVEGARLRGLPILVTHGVHDEVLPIHHARASRELLERLPVELEYREYDMGHFVSPESLRDIKEWLRRRLDEGDRRGE
jgi:phospholipase/carboxylesterase